MYYNKLTSLTENNIEYKTLQKEPENDIDEVKPTGANTDNEEPTAFEQTYGKVMVTKNGMPEDMVSGSEEENSSDSTSEDSDDSGKEDGMLTLL